MTVNEIIESAVGIIQDGAYTTTEVRALLDNVVHAVGSLVRIPSAKKIGSVTVNATETSTNIQTTYPNYIPKFVSKVYNATSAEFVSIYHSLELLFAEYPTFVEEGNIEAVCFEDYMLWSQKAPADDQVLSFVYYDFPGAPSALGNVNWMPAGLHYNIFVCGIAAVAYGELEDGLESDTNAGKPNTGHYAANYYKGIKDYREYVARYSTHRLSSFWSE